MTKPEEKELGQLAYNRLTILAALKTNVHPKSLKEQLREIEKQMVVLGWDGRAHIVTKTRDGFTIESSPIKGNIIRVKPLALSGKYNS